MRPSPLLLAVSAALLLLMGGIVVALVQSRSRAAWAGRVGAVVGGNRAAVARGPSSASNLRRLFTEHPLAVRGWAFIGLRPDKLAEYRPRWFFVLAAAFVAGRILGGIAGEVVSSSLVLPVTALGFVLASRSLFAALDGRRRDKLFRQFPDALGHITRAVRVGIPVVEAIRHVSTEAPAPTAGEFGAIADRLTVGVPLDEALADTAMRTGVPEYNFFATALSLQARTGGGLAETLDNLAEVIRKRVALRERGHALASEARTSAIILGSLPFFTCGLLLVVNPSYVGVLLHTDNGRLALGIAGGMLTAGILTMRFIIRRALA